MPEKITIEELAFEIEYVLKIFPYVNYPWNYLGYLLENLEGQFKFEKLLKDREIYFIDSFDGISRQFLKETNNA